MHALDPRVTSQESPAARGIKKGDRLGPLPGPPESLSDQRRKREGEGVGLFKIEADRIQNDPGETRHDEKQFFMPTSVMKHEFRSFMVKDL